VTGVYVHADRGDQVRVAAAPYLPDTYSAEIGDVTLSLPRDVAERLRDALTAALADHEETPSGH
jgi:hypothetical protein